MEQNNSPIHLVITLGPYVMGLESLMSTTTKNFFKQLLLLTDLTTFYAVEIIFHRAIP